MSEILAARRIMESRNAVFIDTLSLLLPPPWEKPQMRACGHKKFVTRSATTVSQTTIFSAIFATTRRWWNSSWALLPMISLQASVHRTHRLRNSWNKSAKLPGRRCCKKEPQDYFRRDFQLGDRRQKSWRKFFEREICKRVISSSRSNDCRPEHHPYKHN